jgi:fermentation-respiration switch protein FrsA (DUF1100 family)
MFWTFLVPALIAYTAVLVLVFLLQSTLVFHPGVGRGAGASPESYGLRHETVSLPTADGETLHGWWVPADGERGTVLFFHGNAGNISHRLDYVLMLSRLRFATLIVDYRGYGQSSGTPSEAGTYRDAEAAWNYARDVRRARSKDVVIVGESLGGAVASWLAARVDPGAVVLLSTFTSVNDVGAEVYWFLPVRLLSRFEYDTLTNLKAIRAPMFIAHSRQDEIIPYAHGRRLFEAANEPKAFLEMTGGHNDGFIFNRPEWIARLAAFLDRHAVP